MFVKGLTAKSTGSVKSSFESLSKDTKASSNPENKISKFFYNATHHNVQVSYWESYQIQNVSYSKYQIEIVYASVHELFPVSKTTLGPAYNK